MRTLYGACRTQQDHKKNVDFLRSVEILLVLAPASLA